MRARLAIGGRSAPGGPHQQIDVVGLERPGRGRSRRQTHHPLPDGRTPLDGWVSRNQTILLRMQRTQAVVEADVGLKAIVSGSPKNSTGRSSSAGVMSSAPADSRNTSSANSIRTCAPRSATSATRLIASVSSATPTVAMSVCSAGNSCRNFGNSASSGGAALAVAANTEQALFADVDPAPNDRCTSAPSAPAFPGSRQRLSGAPAPRPHIPPIPSTRSAHAQQAGTCRWPPNHLLAGNLARMPVSIGRARGAATATCRSLRRTTPTK